MTDATTENFWQAWNQSVPPAPEVFYRLYHDSQGRPLYYSMEDLPGSWISIDQKTYAQASRRVRVIDGQLQPMPRTVAWTKLVPSDTGTACHPQDVAVISDQEPVQHWTVKAYETN